MSRMNDPIGQGGGAAGIGDKAAEVGQGVREMGAQVRDAAREKYEDLRNQASDYYEQGRQRAQEWEEGVENYVQQQPVKALLIAAGVGFLLGAIWKRS
ncbi:MAG TPA: hypothetical protein VIL86_02315 [Tepidisphaeraceae bacterium]